MLRNLMLGLHCIRQAMVCVLCAVQWWLHCYEVSVNHDAMALISELMYAFPRIIIYSHVVSSFLFSCKKIQQFHRLLNFYY